MWTTEIHQSDWLDIEKESMRKKVANLEKVCQYI